MGHLTSVCLVVLMTVPTLQHKTPFPRTSTSLVSEISTSLPISQPSATTSLKKSLKTPTVTKRGKLHNGTEICQNNTEPVPCSDFYHKNYNVTINDSTPCVFSCSYDPRKLSPLRLEIHQHYKHPMEFPTFVSVKQKHYISSWTMPILSPTKGEDQKFTSLETVLCPPANEKEEIVDFSISGRGSDMNLQIALTNVSFILQKQINVSVTVTPVSPWYKRYQWAASEESVLVTAESDPNVCGILVLQNAKCPVSPDVSGLMGRGRYQTFTQGAGMVARRAEFPDGVHVIVLSLPDDDPCILNPTDPQHNKTRTSRTKTVVLEVYDHATIASTWYIFFLTAIFLTIITVAASVVICAIIKSTLSGHQVSSDDEDPLLGQRAEGPSYRVLRECGVISMGGRENAQCNIPSGRGNNFSRGGQGNNISHNDMGQEGEVLEGGAAEDDIRGARRRGLLAIDASEPVEEAGSHDGVRAVILVQPPSFLPPTTYAPAGRALEVNNSFNPQFVLWWKSVAVHEAGTAEAHVSEVGFQNSLVIMGVFAALPTSELLRSYLGMVLHHGREDQCFWNSRCLTAFASLPDFARVFTNLGYILLGVAFVFIVRKHKTLTHGILKHFSAGNSVGVSHHYGLFISLGYGLVMQGVMSALYHTCPNSVTIKFDMMFMYVIMVVAVVSIWGLRHGDVTHHVYPTVITVGMALLVAEARMWLDREWFWGLLSAVYAILLVSNAVLMFTYGVWSFSLPNLWHLWKGWKKLGERLKNIVEEQDTSCQPMQVVRVMVGLFANIGLITFGVAADPNVYNFILIVCLVNMGLYFANYVLVKKLSFKEKGTVLAWMCLALSMVMWIIALVFFYQRRSDSESSPADSRAENSPCDFLYVFDEHDIWHITSSFALFFFFVALLTMDDDLCLVPSKEICVT